MSTRLRWTGLTIFVASVIAGAIAQGYPQWVDSATSAGFLAGIVLFGVGLVGD